MLNESGLKKRAALMQAIRGFFIDRDYIEVDTPCRLPILIPEAHIEPVASGDHFLQTSPEICMKRLLAESGCSRIFQICKCFRAKERGDRHLPEFTMLEWYRAGSDYQDLMAECEDLIIDVWQKIGHSGSLQFKGSRVSLEKPWHKLTVAEAFDRFAPLSLAQAMVQNSFDEMLCCHIEPRLGLVKPVFLYDYPVELGALARSRKNDPNLAERFELYIGGLELANGFSELTDMVLQRHRFEAEAALIRQKRGGRVELPQKLLAALPKMAETAGIALGVDRLAMMLFNLKTIDQAVTFGPEEL